MENNKFTKDEINYEIISEIISKKKLKKNASSTLIMSLAIHLTTCYDEADRKYTKARMIQEAPINDFVKKNNIQDNQIFCVNLDYKQEINTLKNYIIKNIPGVIYHFVYLGGPKKGWNHNYITFIIDKNLIDNNFHYTNEQIDKICETINKKKIESANFIKYLNYLKDNNKLYHPEDYNNYLVEQALLKS